MQPDGSYINKRERRTSRSLNRGNSGNAGHVQGPMVASEDLGPHSNAQEADEQASAVQELAQENQLPASVISELQQKLKLRSLDKIDETGWSF